MTDSVSPAVLVDAYSQIFRAFYAIAHLTRRDGFPTNALLGMGRLLFQLEKHHAPASGAFFFDCGKPAFRLELAPDYKSNRPPMPEPLRQQMPAIRAMIAAFGWQSCQCENYEADDLIGAAVCALPGTPFRVVSSDKDLSQLIDDRTAMLIPSRSGGWEVRDAEATAARFGVRPGQMVDYLSLLGDSADVIPGVPGIGAKTAAAILHKVGSLAEFFRDPALLDNAGQRQKLLDSRETLERNRKLITLRTEWPAALPAPEKLLRKEPPDARKLAAIFTEYELRSLLKELPEEAARPAPGPAAPEVAKQPEEVDLFSFASAPGKKAPAKNDPAEDDLFAGWRGE